MLIDPIEHGLERLVGPGHHRLVEQTARGGAGQDRRQRERLGAADMVDVGMGQHHPEQVARTLGLSLRTVRRRVAALMTELGADSRFQAGVEAARRGWL